jgi:hypothetical protein
MAIVTSDERITVIILESKRETEALTNLLEYRERLCPANSWVSRVSELDELTNALVGMA